MKDMLRPPALFGWVWRDSKKTQCTMNTFYHSGRIGDIIYSLPAVNAMGGGIFVTGLPSLSQHQAIAPLLQAQHSIFGVRHITEEGLPRGFINLDLFRQAPGLGHIHIVNAHLRAFSYPDYDFDRGGWLQLPWPPKENKIAIINYTGRYEDKLFSWTREAYWMKMACGTVLFLGTPEEYAHFPGKKYTYYLPTRDMLEASLFIRAAQYFSGSQSSLLAIRQGLGLPYRMENSPNHRDCNQDHPRETILNPYSRKLHFIFTTLKKITR